MHPEPCSLAGAGATRPGLPPTQCCREPLLKGWKLSVHPPSPQHHGTHPAHLSKFNNLPHLSDSPHPTCGGSPQPTRTSWPPSHLSSHFHPHGDRASKFNSMVTSPKSPSQVAASPYLAPLAREEGAGNQTEERNPLSQGTHWVTHTPHTSPTFVRNAAPSYILQKRLNGDKSPGRGLSSTGVSAFQGASGNVWGHFCLSQWGKGSGAVACT